MSISLRQLVGDYKGKKNSSDSYNFLRLLAHFNYKTRLIFQKSDLRQYFEKNKIQSY